MELHPLAQGDIYGRLIQPFVTAGSPKLWFGIGADSHQGVVNVLQQPLIGNQLGHDGVEGFKIRRTALPENSPASGGFSRPVRPETPGTGSRCQQNIGKVFLIVSPQNLVMHKGMVGLALVEVLLNEVHDGFAVPDIQGHLLGIGQFIVGQVLVSGDVDAVPTCIFGVQHGSQEDIGL